MKRYINSIGFNYTPLTCFIFFFCEAFVKVGGYEALYHGYMNAIPDTLLNATASNNTCGYPPDTAWTMLRGPTDPDMPWPGFLLGQTPASIWYWCADQVRFPTILMHFDSVGKFNRIFLWSDDGAASAGGEEFVACAGRNAVRRLHQAAARLHHGHPRNDLARPLPQRSGVRRSRCVRSGLRKPIQLLKHRLPEARPRTDASRSVIDYRFRFDFATNR